MLPSRPRRTQREGVGGGDEGDMSLERNGTVSRIREIVLDQVLQKFVDIALFS